MSLTETLESTLFLSSHHQKAQKGNKLKLALYALEINMICMQEKWSRNSSFSQILFSATHMCMYSKMSFSYKSKKVGARRGYSDKGYRGSMIVEIVSSLRICCTELQVLSQEGTL